MEAVPHPRHLRWGRKAGRVGMARSNQGCLTRALARVRLSSHKCEPTWAAGGSTGVGGSARQQDPAAAVVGAAGLGRRGRSPLVIALHLL